MMGFKVLVYRRCRMNSSCCYFIVWIRVGGSGFRFWFGG